jgi:hypothetical protein
MKAGKALDDLDRQLGIDPLIRTLDHSPDRYERGVWFGYNWALSLLMIASFLAIFAGA